jgi:hypothetical protein
VIPCPAGKREAVLAVVAKDAENKQIDELIIDQFCLCQPSDLLADRVLADGRDTDEVDHGSTKPRRCIGQWSCVTVTGHSTLRREDRKTSCQFRPRSIEAWGLAQPVQFAG